MQINQAKFTAIVETAKAKAANSPAWLRSLEKAAAAILDGSMIVTTLAHGALVTTPGGTYHANGVCYCPARTKHCYHRAGARLMAIYEEETAPAAVSLEADIAATPRKTLIVEIQAAWPKAWPPMADELVRRFRVNTLDYLAEDMLRAVRLAIAA